MSPSNREIELKFAVGGEHTLESLRKQLEAPEPTLATALYWALPKSGSFIRVRTFGLHGKKAEVSVKHEDQGNTLDRIEENAEVSSRESITRVFEAIHGAPKGGLTTKYTYTPYQEAILSLYQVNGKEELILEVEADSLEALTKSLASLQKTHRLELRRIYNSVYDMYVVGNGPKYEK